MMKLAGKLLAAAAVAVTAGLSPAVAGDFDKAIKARKAQMQLYAWNISTLGAMAKGVIPYDAEAAQAAATNLAALSKMGNAAMWPQGSDSTALPGKTRTKVEAWTTWPAIAENSKQMVMAADKMAEVAGTGLDAVKAQIGAVGGSCGACHKKYRAEE